MSTCCTPLPLNQPRTWRLGIRTLTTLASRRRFQLFLHPIRFPRTSLRFAVCYSVLRHTIRIRSGVRGPLADILFVVAPLQSPARYRQRCRLHPW